MTGVGGIPPSGQSRFLTRITEGSRSVLSPLKKLDIKDILGSLKLKNNLIPIACAALTLLTASCFYGLTKELHAPEAATDGQMKIFGLSMAFLFSFAGTGTLAILLISAGRRYTVDNRSAEAV